ncbi:hypothetical protein [Micromonospora taraxaci]|uniref:hypothetical protein n=1 Tax=Micromonospora taraxaci TaxID=1316803 RepID=UPI0033A97452
MTKPIRHLAIVADPADQFTDEFTDEFAPLLAEQLRDPEVRAAYEAEQREDDEVIQFGHPRWGL